ncbi:MAG: ketoacyl-ACP synthase III [Clostridia bacterium]|nr:ketoacyl-ACP synthase III [Clostridia bacterium]
MKSLRSVGIIGTGSYVPERKVTNFDMEKIVDTSDEWIRTRTGIGARHFAADDETTSDMAAKAALKAMEAANVTADEIDLIIVGTLTPDMLLPSTACLVQDKIGANGSAAFDLETACSGFIYAMEVGRNFVATGMYNKVLVIGAEKLSSFLDFEDRATCVLFGDGAGAAVLGPVEDGKGILSSELGADGSKGMVLKIDAGGCKMPASEQTLKDRLHYITMDGSEVFKFAVRIMGSASLNVVEKAGLTLDDINFLVPHQANMRIISAAAKKLNLPLEKVQINLTEYGNMSAASVPVALDQAIREGKIKEGDKTVLVGFGGGLTWGACVIQW